MLTSPPIFGKLLTSLPNIWKLFISAKRTKCSVLFYLLRPSNDEFSQYIAYDKVTTAPCFFSVFLSYLYRTAVLNLWSATVCLVVREQMDVFIFKDKNTQN